VQAAPFPERVQPMLAKAGPMPPEDVPDGEYAYELKWDGIRAIAYVQGGELRLESRNLNDLTAQYPEIAAIVEALAGHDVVLDGEIVAMDERGLPSFQRLQSRLGLKSPATIRARAEAVPATYAIFDVLHLDGRDLMPLPLSERREVLESIEGIQAGPAWRVPAMHRTGGHDLLRAVVERGIEGVMVKRLASTYNPGRRSSDWTKVKQQQRQEFIVCGWTEGGGSRSGAIGSLLLGVHDVRPDAAQHRGERQLLEFVGSVGTGFNRAMLGQLQELLDPLAIDESPFDVRSPGSVRPQGKWQAMRAKDRAPAAGGDSVVHYVEPRLVCEVEYTEFTRDGTLRHPSFQGLRDDTDPADVVREDREAKETQG